jgi:hypothetical protein
MLITPIYQPETILVSPNQDRSLRLICYSIDGFPNSIYDYKQSFMTIIFCVIISLLTP